MEVDGRDGIGFGPHGQGALHQTDALPVLLLQIEIVGLHIEGKGPQPRRQLGQKILGRGQALRQGQMEQHRRSRPHKGRCSALFSRLGTPAQGGFQLGQSHPGLLDLPQGKVGIGIDEAGGKPGFPVRVGQVKFRLPGGLFGLSAEIVVLRRGNVPLWPFGHGCND